MVIYATVLQSSTVNSVC